jgi:hypothetical protein
MLAKPRAGAAVAALPGRKSALVIGGYGDKDAPPPIERLDLAGVPQGSSPMVQGALAATFFPTATLIDGRAASPRVLISGGLAIEGGTALEPQKPGLVLLRGGADFASVSVDTAPVTGTPVQAQCGQDGYFPVVWDAATPLVSGDGFLVGDRVLLSGGSPETCNCPAGEMSHTCATNQASIVTVPVDASAKLSLARSDGLQQARFGHTQTLLPDHTVLVAGGLYRRGGMTYGAVDVELYNPMRRTAPGATGDVDDPLRAELSLAGLTRAPGALATNGKSPTAIACLVPTK